MPFYLTAIMIFIFSETIITIHKSEKKTITILDLTISAKDTSSYEKNTTLFITNPTVYQGKQATVFLDYFPK